MVFYLIWIAVPLAIGAMVGKRRSHRGGKLVADAAVAAICGLALLVVWVGLTLTVPGLLVLLEPGPTFAFEIVAPLLSIAVVVIGAYIGMLLFRPKG